MLKVGQETALRHLETLQESDLLVQLDVVVPQVLHLGLEKVHLAGEPPGLLLQLLVPLLEPLPLRLEKSTPNQHNSSSTIGESRTCTIGSSAFVLASVPEVSAGEDPSIEACPSAGEEGEEDVWWRSISADTAGGGLRWLPTWSRASTRMSAEERPSASPLKCSRIIIICQVDNTLTGFPSFYVASLCSSSSHQNGLKQLRHPCTSSSNKP